jgi:hypothetical protein
MPLGSAQRAQGQAVVRLVALAFRPAFADLKVGAAFNIRQMLASLGIVNRQRRCYIRI